MGKENYTRILWLDLESTGSDESEDVIEIGAVMTDLDWNEIDRFQKVYSTRKGFSGLAPVVQEMHYNNGLWSEVQIAKRDFPDGEREFLNWLGPDKTHILLAGSGVSHFDRRYIKRDWPRVDKRLTYYSLDIGVVRRFIRLSTGETPALVGLLDTKSHRALNDTLECIEEAKEYRRMMSIGHWAITESDKLEPYV